MRVDPGELRRAIRGMVPHRNRAQRRAKKTTGAVSTATRNKQAADEALRRARDER